MWEHNYLHDNNNPDVPGNGISGLARGGPVGTGLILAGTRDVTLYKNVITNNNAWGALVVDLPDQETACVNVPANAWCRAPLPANAGVAQAGVPAVGGVIAIGLLALSSRMRRRRPGVASAG